MKNIYQKKAFTLLEVIMVTVILGIVASIGSSVIVQVYESYFMQRSIHNASLKSELAINQLANRLTYRIGGSLLARKPDSKGVASTNALPLSEILPSNTTHTALEWIGYDNDGFTTQGSSKQGFVPAWSGFCDLNASNFTRITTRSSRLQAGTGTIATEQEILNSLTSKSITPAPAIIFATQTYRNPALGTSREYNTTCMHQTDGTGCMFPVTLTNNSTLTFRSTGLTGDRTNGEMVYSEFYKLAASAYAVVPEDKKTINNIDVWDLYLYADYQPWNGNGYKNGTKSLLAKNVSVFRFRQEGGSLRIKICSVEQTDLTNTLSICKEKAVIQ